MNGKKKIGAIIVLYNPDKNLFKEVLDSVISQVDSVFIADNTPIPYDQYFLEYQNVTYHFMGGNKGIATAQNKGLEFFEKKGFDFIIYLDQDSIAPSDLVEKLMKNFNYLKKQIIEVGGICARTYNREEKTKYTASIRKGVRINKNITEVSEIISSSSLIPLKNFKKVGKMEDKLFIDAVDFEWCWRASKIAKLRFFISEDVLLSHKLGEKKVTFFKKTISIHIPIRQYYRYRNFLWLAKRNYVPLYWKLSNTMKYMIKYFYLPLFVPPRKEYFKQINKGIYHGFKESSFEDKHY